MAINKLGENPYADGDKTDNVHLFDTICTEEAKETLDCIKALLETDDTEAERLFHKSQTLLK